MNFIEQIVEHILRPMRQQYRPNRLGTVLGYAGPKQFSVQSVQTGRPLTIERLDDTLLNRHGRRLHLSLFEIQQSQKSSSPCPYVIYLHANNGCRLEGITYLKALLENEMNVVVFDCTGSGLSDGEYVSLGIRQSEDLEHIVEYLVSKRKVKDVCLWGRSMGAVTALLFASKSKHRELVRCCIYDSPFRSLKRLIKQLASQKTGLPQFAFTPLIPMIDGKIQDKCGWGLNELKLKPHIKNISVPGLFVTSKNDKMVPCQHAEKLFNSYPAYKQIEYIKEQHHENRPDSLVDKCVTFLKRGLEMRHNNEQPHQTMKRKLHNIFTSGSLLSCKSVKSSGKMCDISNMEDNESVSSLYSNIPSSVSNKPGKVSVTSLKKILDKQQHKPLEVFHEEGRFNPFDHSKHFDHPSSTQPLMRKVLQPEPTSINLQHRPNVHNKLVVQNHLRGQHDFNSKGITLVSKRAEV